MTEQWQNFLKNLGEWRGSFTRMSPNGDLLDSTPSLLTLTQKPDLVEFRLRRYSSGCYDDPPSQDYSQTYTSLGRQACFFESGAFSKGSLQFNPYGEFGAEYGFIDGDRRSRLVQLFATPGECTSLTLIREFRSHTDAQERPPLQVEQLQGVWQGMATTHYADGRDPDICETQIEVQIQGDQLHQHLSFAGQTLRSSAQIQGTKLWFEQSQREMLLLPDGVSSHIPSKLVLGQPFFVEAGWLVSERQRQRLIRSYNAQGEWVSATWVRETKN